MAKSWPHTACVPPVIFTCGGRQHGHVVREGRDGNNTWRPLAAQKFQNQPQEENVLLNITWNERFQFSEKPHLIHSQKLGNKNENQDERCRACADGAERDYCFYFWYLNHCTFRSIFCACLKCHCSSFWGEFMPFVGSCVCSLCLANSKSQGALPTTEVGWLAGNLSETEEWKIFRRTV